jgi:hypothetical protein
VRSERNATVFSSEGSLCALPYDGTRKIDVPDLAEG